MAYRFLDPNPVYFELDATRIAANGSLTFYNINTTTPKNTFNSEALSTPNPNPVPLDAAGRASVEVWLDGDYTVVLKDDLGATVWTRDVIDSASGGTTIPALVSGEFLTNDGINLQWDAVRQVPDPTGQANRILSTDGSNLLWINQQAIPQPDITTTTTSITIGDGTRRYRILTGSATAPSSGTNRTSLNITFPSAFSQTPIWIDVKVNQVPISDAALVATAVTNQSTTGFLATFDVADRHFVTGTYINASFPFRWIAIGEVAA